VSGATTGGATDGNVTRADIEAKLEEIRGFTERSMDTATKSTKGAAVGGAAIAVVVAYLMGRRRGRRRRTVVEVRRL